MVLAVLFSVSSSSYALPCQSVIEVVPLLELRRALSSPPWMAGDFAYRGALVSVIDACVFLGGYTCSRRLSSRLALVACAGDGEPRAQPRIWGIMGERMTAVRRLEGSELSTSADKSSYLGPVVKQGAQLVQIIDINGLISAARAAAPVVAILSSGDADDPH